VARWFSQVLEDIKKRGKSQQEIKKKRLGRKEKLETYLEIESFYSSPWSFKTPKGISVTGREGLFGLHCIQKAIQSMKL
jgi:hypothetical protein